MHKPTTRELRSTFRVLHELAQLEPPTPEGRQAVAALWHAAAIVRDRGELNFLNRKCPLDSPLDRTQSAELRAEIKKQDEADAIDAARTVQQIRAAFEEAIAEQDRIDETIAQAEHIEDVRRGFNE